MADGPCQPHCSSAEVLRRLEVRAIRPEERAAWDALVQAHRDLGLHALFGRTLRYVAALDGCWVALLGWPAAALQCAARDAWDSAGGGCCTTSACT